MRRRRRCRNCKTSLGAWETSCPCCRGSAMRWLHLVPVGAFSLAAVLYLLATAR